MTVYVGPDEWAEPRQAEWEAAAACGMADRDDFAEQIEEQEFIERHKPLPPALLEQAKVAAKHGASRPVPVPSYVKRSAA